MVRRRRGLAAALPKPHAPCKRSPHRCRPRLAARKAAGPVAQWLEPAAHNGLVAGSSPAGPTNIYGVFLNFSRARFRSTTVSTTVTFCLRSFDVIAAAASRI